MAKLLENIFRSVNIALVNELGMLAERMGVDIYEVIDAAATKPFGYMRFEPGPGMGGHCLPVDPFYLSWKAREYDFSTEFIELAGKVNQNMPYVCVERAERALNDAGKAVRGSKIAILGVAYKPAVGDIRESPSLKIIERLQSLGGEVVYHDAFVPELPKFGLTNVALEEALDGADIVLIVTAHPGIDHVAIAAAAADGRLPRGHPHHSGGSEAADGDGCPAEAGHRVRAHGGGGMKRLMIVADHSFVVQAIRLALRQTAGFQVVGFFDGRNSISEALQQLQAGRRPRRRHAGDRVRDVARLREIGEETPDAKSLMLTLRMDSDALDAAFTAGAHAVVSKNVHPVSLGTLLREISLGNVVHRYEPKAAVIEQADCPLTDRELEILRLVAEGYTNNRIARQLWVTEQTVKFHLSNTYRKLGVANRTEASRYAHVHNLTAPQTERLAS